MLLFTRAVNQKNTANKNTGVSKIKTIRKNTGWGFPRFIKHDLLPDTKSRFLKDDTIIIDVYLDIHVKKSLTITK